MTGGTSASPLGHKPVRPCHLAATRELAALTWGASVPLGSGHAALASLAVHLPEPPSPRHQDGAGGPCLSRLQDDAGGSGQSSCARQRWAWERSQLRRLERGPVARGLYPRPRRQQGYARLGLQRRSGWQRLPRYF